MTSFNMDEDPSAVDPSVVDTSAPSPEVNTITRSVDVDHSALDPSSPLLECIRCHVAKPVSAQPCNLCNSPILLQIPCPNASFGCIVVLGYDKVSNNSEECEYTTSSMPFTRCDFTGPYRELYSHASKVHSDEVQLIECGVPLVFSFGHRRRVVLKESSYGGELLLLQRELCHPEPRYDSYSLSCISPKVPTMGNFSFRLFVTCVDAEGRSGSTTSEAFKIIRVNSAWCKPAGFLYVHSTEMEGHGPTHLIRLCILRAIA